IRLILRRLRGDVVAHAVLRVQPERRCRLKTTAQRHKQVARDVTRRITGLLRLGSVDIDLQLRSVERLLNSQVRRAWNIFDFVQELVSIPAISLDVLANDLNVNWCRQTKVQDLADNICRQKI